MISRFFARHTCLYGDEASHVTWAVPRMHRDSRAHARIVRCMDKYTLLGLVAGEAWWTRMASSHSTASNSTFFFPLRVMGREHYLVVSSAPITGSVLRLSFYSTEHDT